MSEDRGRILDGKAIGEKVRGEVRQGVAAFVARHGRVPGLHVVLVGDDAASQVYTRNKEKACREVGMRGHVHVLPTSTTEATLLALVDALNRDDAVDGILVQLPLPPAIREHVVLDAVAPAKDVDGFHPVNVGLLASGRPALAPCTPQGCMRLIAEAGVDAAGKSALVLGRSAIVGRPVAQLLLAAHATVTIAHSRTPAAEIEALCRRADVLVVAVGRPGLVRGAWIKPGAVVIDVGINRLEGTPNADGTPGKARLVGDVAFDEAREHASAITPVPGGVGPLTIAYLLQNTLDAASAREAARQPTTTEVP